jgi:hypothetical protein
MMLPCHLLLSSSVVFSPDQSQLRREAHSTKKASVAIHLAQVSWKFAGRDAFYSYLLMCLTGCWTHMCVAAMLSRAGKMENITVVFLKKILVPRLPQKNLGPHTNRQLISSETVDKLRTNPATACLLISENGIMKHANSLTSHFFKSETKNHKN